MTNNPSSGDIGALDPLDIGLRDSGAAPLVARTRWFHHRLALGLPTSTVPASLLLLVGAALGPHGVNVLSANVLVMLDPGVPPALAALGVLVGLEFGGTGVARRRLYAAPVASALTLATVFAGMWAIHPLWTSSSTAWLLAATLGICASTSGTVVSPTIDRGRANDARATDFDVLLPVVVGALTLAMFREGSLARSLALAGQSAGVSLVMALAGWLLLRRTASDTEQRVFAVGTILIVGGAAEYLSLSELFAGLIAGMFWQVARGGAGEWIRRDVLHVQHPLVVFTLLVAGARAAVSPSLLAVAGVYVLLRATGKLTGGWILKRIARDDLAAATAPSLISPGILGVAYGLNVLRAVGPSAESVLTVTVVGAVASELLSALLRPRSRAAT